MLEWMSLSDATSAHTPSQLAQMVMNVRTHAAYPGDVLPVVREPGGPALAWVNDLAVRDGELWALVRWLDVPEADDAREIGAGDLVASANAVAAESGQHVGAELHEVVCCEPDIDPYEATLAEHARDEREDERTNLMDPETIVMNAARSVAKRDGITLAEAERRVRLAATKPLNNTGHAPACIPQLPAPGVVTDARTARIHLAAHHPAWGAMNNEERHAAALTLRDMAGDMRATLTRVPTDGKACVLLALFPGATRTARARSYLCATEQGFATLPYDQQHMRASALRSQVHVLDGGAP